MRGEKVVVFLGPSLEAGTAKKILNHVKSWAICIADVKNHEISHKPLLGLRGHGAEPHN